MFFVTEIKFGMSDIWWRRGPDERLPQNASAKRPEQVRFALFLYPSPTHSPGGLEAEAGVREGGTDMENDT